MSFAILGLGPAEQAAYELLIDDPSAVSWTRPEPLPDLLARLEELGLVVPDPLVPLGYRAIAPAIAFDALLDRARRHIDALDAAYQARPTETVIEVVTGARPVAQRLLRLQAGARSSIDYLASAVDPDPVGNGVTCRAIYARSAIEPPGALTAVEHLINAGQLTRVLPDLPVTLFLADNKLAALPGPSDTLLVIHPSALLDALIALFDALWQRALPLHSPPTRASSQRLITLLLSGLTDEAIAHQLAVSHRTIQRRVASLMSDLGAHTRFQAGIQAALLRPRGPSG